MIDGKLYGFLCANAPGPYAAMLSTVVSVDDPVERWRLMRGPATSEIRHKIDGMLMELDRGAA